MARIGSEGKVSSEITIVLSEQEAGALDAIAGYGVDDFLKTFYKEMGEAYLKPYEQGLRSLFTSVHGDHTCDVSAFIQRAKDARAVMTGRMKAVRIEDVRGKE